MSGIGGDEFTLESLLFAVRPALRSPAFLLAVVSRIRFVIHNRTDDLS